MFKILFFYWNKHTKSIVSKKIGVFVVLIYIIQVWFMVFPMFFFLFTLKGLRNSFYCIWRLHSCHYSISSCLKNKCVSKFKVTQIRINFSHLIAYWHISCHIAIKFLNKMNYIHSLCICVLWSWEIQPWHLTMRYLYIYTINKTPKYVTREFTW